MKNTILTLCISSFLIACSNDKQPENISISGNIVNLPEGSVLYLDYLHPKQIVTKDSTTINENGNYYFQQPIEEHGFYRLRINNQNFINLVLDKNEQPIINGDGNNIMDTYSISGSLESNRLKDFNIAYKKNALLQDSLKRFYDANRGDRSVFDQVQIASFTSSNQTNEYFIQLIKDNPASLVSMAIVEQFDPKTYGELFTLVDEALFEKMPNSIYYQRFHEKVANIINLKEGDVAPDFTLNDLSGNPISLSSLKGKVVLLDFWASWCRPCRIENPNLVKAYNKYHSKGFEVLSVSLDGMPQQQNPKEDWLNAIKKDGLVWNTHISDLKGWESEAVGIYGVESIPFTLLIDKEGIILGKNLRGPQLENKLNEIF
ncbi:MAG: AhpC/TSA family protein [Vicingus serpentipes]|nr:AhpC/TSA family protein [Vicingus serpentipes]